MGFAMHQYIILLSDLSYEHGLIGIAEYKERREVAHWLSVDEQGQQDPRDSRHEEPGRLREFDEERGDNRGGSGSGNDPEEDPTDQWPRFLALNKWMFTAGDRDCYPSVPHGHLHRKTNEWPKLNHGGYIPRPLGRPFFGLREPNTPPLGAVKFIPYTGRKRSFDYALPREG